MASAQAVAKNAFEHLAETVTVEHERSFYNTSIADVWKEVQKIETEQAAQRDNRFMRRLEPLIQTLESYSGVLDTLCQGYPPMSFVWGPLKLMLVLAKNYTTIMDIILQAFSDIADALPRIDRLKATFPKDANLNRAVALIYADILEFHGRAYKMFTRRAWHYYFAFNWGFFERRFKSVLHNLRRHCELLDKEAAIAHFAEMRSDRDQRKCEDKAFEHRRRIQMSRDVFVLLSASEGPQEDKLRRISDTRQLGTCDWIFDDPQLKPWIEGSLGHDALWVNGIPGSGKTYITSLLVEHLQSRDNGCCGYFFCDQKVSTGVDCVNILRTLAVQIFQQNEDITPLIHEIFIEKLSTYSSSAIKKMLIQIIPHVKPTHIVLDGIDELNIPLQEDILKIMLEVVRNSNHNCKLLVVSREEPQIRKFFLGKQMKLEAQTAEGLRQYINRSMDELRSQHTTMEPALIKDINLNLHKKAKGMFLWVRLVTANLLEKGSLLEIETAMNELPDGLDKAYDRILNRFRCVNDSLRRRIFKIFHWLSVTRRPLSVHEVIDGIALDFHQPLLNRKTRINNVQHAVLDLCAPLLEITTHGTLELVHFSAKEYILASGSGPFTKEHQAHFEVAKCCVLNLNSMVDLIPNFTELTDNEIEKLVVQGQYGLHDYASEFWAEHLLHYKAYNAESGNAGNENENKLIYELHRLTRMVKGSYAAQAKDQPVLRSETLSVGLRKLEDEPKIWRLITSHVTMSEKIEAVKGKYSEVKDQETQLLLSDETHLTQIKLRLREIREKILSRISGDLPAHISELDYESFRSRYRFCCKNVGCSQNFQSAKERDDHQQRHMITFPCPDCDFSFRGFSSRRDLDRHLAKYHRSPAEIDIPSSIQSVGFGKVAGTIGNRHNFEERWTECGRQAKKNSFRQILKVLDATLNSPKTAHAHTSQKPTADQFDQLGLLEKNIEQRNYETLEQFKNDVRSIISAAYPERNKENEAIIEYSCYNGLKCVSNTYPGFAAAEFAPSRNFFEMSIGTGQNDLSRLTGRDIGNTETTLSEGSSPQRRVYWSKMDATEFPSLLKRFGKDFGKIADTLKTKTEDDVARFYDHFTENGKSDPCETPKSSVSIDYPENAEPNPAFGEAISNDQSLSAVSVPELATFPAQDVHFLQNVAESNHASMNQQRDVSAAPRPKNKRRQRRRAFCPFCTDYPDGLHDEYALRKHYNRVHCPTRKVWTCADISLDKFLADCKKCAGSKGYRTETNARKHLRDFHFSDETPPETLKRWIVASDEPNPSFKREADSEISSGEPKRWKTNPIAPQLPHGIAHIQEQQLLPSIDTIFSSIQDTRQPMREARQVPEYRYSANGTREQSPASRRSSIDKSDDAESSDDNNENRGLHNNKFDNFDLHTDVSFEDILGTRSMQAHAPREDGPPHLLNRALIVPDQVSRLPHLTQEQRTIYLDQVQALHARLERGKPDSQEYQRQLEKLERLSRNLMSNLRNWMGRRARAYDPVRD